MRRRKSRSRTSTSARWSIRGATPASVPRTIALDAFYRQLGAHPGGTAEAEAARREVFATVAITMRARVSRAPEPAATSPTTGDLRQAS